MQLISPKENANSKSSSLLIDPRNGFCNENSTFNSKRKPLQLPTTDSLNITTFVSSQVHSGTIAFIDAATDHHISYSELWRAVDSVADCLYHGIGVRRGDIVLIFSSNPIFIPILSLAVMSLGAIISTANPLYTAREISSQIADSHPKIVFTNPELAIKLASFVVSIILELVDCNLRVPEGMKIVGILSEMMKKQPNLQRVRERVNKDDTAILLYSSGTTGKSKGVDSTHGNLIAHVAGYIAEPFEQPTQTFVSTVPLFHSYGLHNFALATVALGTKVVILPKFELGEMMAAIEKYRATTVVLVPPIIVATINKANMIKAKYDVSSLKTLRCSGAPLSKEVTEAFVKEYPWVDIYQGYALTESNAAGSTVESVEESRRYGSVGLLSCGVEAKIVDPGTGRFMGVNQTGELWLKGPSIAKGYYKNEEATKESRTPEGWLKTGDICYIDEDGFLFIVDRLKELIKYKGYQVAPAELEALLLNHPQILDAAVIPFPCKETGQYPMAYVVRKQESDLSETQVINFISKQVAAYKKIRNVAFINSIPKTPSGTILRKDLVKLAISKI